MHGKTWLWMLVAWVVAVGLYFAISGNSFVGVFSTELPMVASTAPQPPPPPPPPAPAPDPVDTAIEALRTGAFAFQAPDTLGLGKIQTVTAILSVTKNADDLVKLLQGQFPAQGAQVGVSPIMTATLTGLGFEISPAGPQTQAISATQDTPWTWQVKPTQPGPLTLEITLSAIIQVDGQSVPRQVRQLDRIINVAVPPPTLLDRFKAAMDPLKDLEWLWTTLLVPAAVWLYSRWRKPKPEGAG